MFMHPTHPMEHDEVLKEIEGHLCKLEHGIIQEYRRLLQSARKGMDELLKFPAQVALRFQQILAKLQRVLESGGDRGALRLVTELQEELRIRMLVLEHLLERDIPYAYLERAFNAQVRAAIFAHRGEGADPTPWEIPDSAAMPSENFVQPRGWFNRIFGRKTTAPAPQHRVRATGTANVRGQVRKWFHHLPDYLKSLFLLHAFMEKDELRLLPPSQRPPSLGADYQVHWGVAVFDGADGGEYHWRDRVERRQAKRIDDATLTKSLREKLEQGSYTVGVQSRFHSQASRANLRAALTPSQFMPKVANPALPPENPSEPSARMDPRPAHDKPGLALDLSY